MNTNIDYSKYQFDGKVSTKNEEEVLANINTDYTNSFIFITLNSWKPKTREEYKKIINDVLTKLNKNKRLNIIGQWYYEDKDSNGNQTRLHVHGMFSNVPNTYHPYGGLLTDISKMFHKQIGKPYVTHTVSADIQWANSNDAVAQYCKKQKGLVNYYIPNFTY